MKLIEDFDGQQLRARSTSGMRICMIAPYLPMPTTGGRNRMWQQIRHLAADNELTVVSLAHSTESADHFEQLEGTCRLFTVPVDAMDLWFDPNLPATINQYKVAAMHRLLAKLARESFDAVFFEHIYTAFYRDLFGAEAILTEHNIESQVLHRISLIAQDEEGNNEAWRLARYEDAMWPTFPLRVTVSSHDKAIMEGRCGAGRTIVAENGVDCSFMAFQPTLGHKTLLFMGNLQYLPNIDAVRCFRRDVMPLIWAGDPDIRLLVAGASPGPDVRALASDARIKVIADPPDIRAITAQASLAVAPMRAGGGTRIKILEAMALGLPVVSTGLGAEGLDLEPDRYLMIGENPAALARHCLDLHANPDKVERMRRDARRAVEQRYRWNVIFASLAGEVADHAERAKGATC